MITGNCNDIRGPDRRLLYTRIIFNSNTVWNKRCLKRRSTAARPLRLWVRILPGWMSVCCVLSGRGLCDVLITRPEEPYRLWRVVVCD